MMAPVTTKSYRIELQLLFHIYRAKANITNCNNFLHANRSHARVKTVINYPFRSVIALSTL